MPYNNDMKKVVSLVLIAALSLLMLAVAACGGVKPTRLTVTKDPDTIKVVQVQGQGLHLLPVLRPLGPLLPALRLPLSRLLRLPKLHLPVPPRLQQTQSPARRAKRKRRRVLER